MRKDAEFQWELQQIAGGGPNWKDQLQPDADMGGEVPGMGGGTPAGTPPDFGGSPADTGGEAEAGGEAEGAAEAGGEAGPAEPAV